MKRKALSLLLCGAMVGTLLTGCSGKDTKVSKVDDSTYEIQSSTEVTEPTEPATEVAESTEEIPEELVDGTTESTEAVADDFLSQHGIVPLTQYSDVDVTLAVGSDVAGTLSDDTEIVPITAMGMIFDDDVPEGYVSEGIIFTLPQGDYSYNVSAFDRYTGTSFESKAEDLNNGSVNQSAVIIDVDGKQYACSLSADMTQLENGDMQVVMKVMHPVEYDGVVFEFGQQTKTQKAAYDAIDFNSTFTVADYADVFIDGQTFFTTTGK